MVEGTYMASARHTKRS